VSSIGLKPANEFKRKSISNKGKVPSMRNDTDNNRFHRLSRKHHGVTSDDITSKVLPIVRKIPIEVQLKYSRNGSAALRSFFDPDAIRLVRSDLIAYSEKKKMEAWRQKVEVASNDPILGHRCRTVAECKEELATLGVEVDNLPFLQYFNTWRDVASVKKLCYSLGQTASVLLDVPAVRLYQDALFEKRAGDGPTPWHTDARMAPFDTTNMLTFWIPLQDVSKHGTALLFVPKSHNDFALPFWNEFDGPEYDRLEERYNNKSLHYMPLNLGDLTVHSGWTLHCADGNDSSEDRLALAISYVDARAEIRETAMNFSPSTGGGYGDNEDQWSYREWVGQVPVRKPFGTHPLVPIVWPAK
jgi:ectoine hydroxylase-related dioxygenase (phytanoyl-CoA dioxygenase family)